jgi:hypothetical protein
MQLDLDGLMWGCVVAVRRGYQCPDNINWHNYQLAFRTVSNRFYAEWTRFNNLKTKPYEEAIFVFDFVIVVCIWSVSGTVG